MNIKDVLNTISDRSKCFEKNMDVLFKKRTGSYYTSMILTIKMMEDLIKELPKKWKENIHSLRFLEPCVGTGNFVFAYLYLCYKKGLIKAQYETLLNNIYVCDSNQKALDIYKTNLTFFAKHIFDITLNEDYFNKHIGHSIIIDFNDSTPTYIPIEQVFSKEIVQNGFDIIVTNPPYKNLRAEKSHYENMAEYEQDRNKFNQITKVLKKHFKYSQKGGLNLYKIFVEEILKNYVSPNGFCSLLIPNSVLSDLSCTKLREYILTSSQVISIHVIPENNLFINASQALCSMVLHKGASSQTIHLSGSLNKHENFDSIISVQDCCSKENGYAFLFLQEKQYEVRRKLSKFPKIKELNYIKNLRGELDLTLDKKYITQKRTPYLLCRGRNLSGCYESKEYVLSEFITKSPKQCYISQDRLACQQISNMSKKQRLHFSYVQQNCVLGNSCNFITILPNKYDVDLYFMLGILNSKIMNWFFKTTSSNNHINNYEIDNFPIPINYDKKNIISHYAQQYIQTNDESVLKDIEKLVLEAYDVENIFGDEV